MSTKEGEDVVVVELEGNEETVQVEEEVVIVEETVVVEETDGNSENTNVEKSKSRGRALASSAGDFIGRLSTLIVMILATLNTILVCITSFIDEVWWQAGLTLGLLVFIHIPVLIMMLYFMCIARVVRVVRKVHRRKKVDVEAGPGQKKGGAASVKATKPDSKVKLDKDQKTSNGVRIRNPPRKPSLKKGYTNKGFNATGMKRSL